MIVSAVAAALVGSCQHIASETVAYLVPDPIQASYDTSASPVSVA